VPVFTQSEIKERSLEKKKSKRKKRSTTVTSGGLKKDFKPPEVIKEKSFDYYLLYPENGFDFLSNFEDTIIIENKSYNRICCNGVVKTCEKPLVDFLLTKDYSLMEKIERY